MAERFDRLGLAGAGRAERRAAEARLQRLRHRQVAAVRQRRLHQPVLHAQVLETVLEARVGHVDRQLFQDAKTKTKQSTSNNQQQHPGLDIG